MSLNQLMPGMIQVKGKKITFAQTPYMGSNDRLWDLALIISEFDLSDDESNTLLKGYSGGVQTDPRLVYYKICTRAWLAAHSLEMAVKKSTPEAEAELGLKHYQHHMEQLGGLTRTSIKNFRADLSDRSSTSPSWSESTERASPAQMTDDAPGTVRVPPARSYAIWSDNPRAEQTNIWDTTGPDAPSDGPGALSPQ